MSVRYEVTIFEADPPRIVYIFDDSYAAKDLGRFTAKLDQRRLTYTIRERVNGTWHPHHPHTPTAHPTPQPTRHQTRPSDATPPPRRHATPFTDDPSTSEEQP